MPTKSYRRPTPRSSRIQRPRVVSRHPLTVLDATRNDSSPRDDTARRLVLPARRSRRPTNFSRAFRRISSRSSVPNRTEPDRTESDETTTEASLFDSRSSFVRSFIRSSQTPDRRTSDDTERVNASKHVRRSRVVYLRLRPASHRRARTQSFIHSFIHYEPPLTRTHRFARVGLNDGIGTIYTRRTDRRVIPIAIRPSSPRVDSRVRRTTTTATTRLMTVTRSRRLRRARRTPKTKTLFRVTTKRRREDDTKRRGES